jgi:rod shape-determining protein MreD
VSPLARALGLAALLVAQAALTPWLAVGGVRPDLPVVVVLVVGLAAGPLRGGLAGLVVGGAVDLLRGSRLGLCALAAAAAGWLCGEATSRVDPGRPAVRWVVCTGAAVAYGLLLAGAAAVLGRGGVDARGAVRHALLAGAYDGTLAAVAYWLLALARHDPLPLGTRPLQGWLFPLGERRRRRGTGGGRR